MQTAPKLKRMQSKCNAGILSAIDISSLKLDIIAADQNDVHVLLLSCDNAAANRKAIRHIVASLVCMPNVFVGTLICFARTLSLSAKYGSLLFPVGGVIRVTHYLRCRPMKKIDSFVSNSTLPGEIDTPERFSGKTDILYSARN